MGAIYVCSNCLKKESAQAVKQPDGPRFAWVKPKGWLARWDGDTIVDACSESCANSINEKTQTKAEIWGDVNSTHGA